MKIQLPNLLVMPTEEDLRIFGNPADRSETRRLHNESFRTFDRRVALEPPPLELIPGFLREGITGFNAQPRGAKTMQMLDLSIGLCTGSTILGGRYTAAKPYAVGYVTEEDSPHRIRQRLRAMLVGRMVQADAARRLKPPTLQSEDLPANLFLSVRQGLNFDYDTHKEWLYKWVCRNNVEVLITEPLRSLVSGTDGSYEAIKPWIDYCRALLRECPTLKAMIWGYHNTRPGQGKDMRGPVEQTSGFPIISAVETPYSLQKLSSFGKVTKVLLSATYQKDATDDLQLEIHLESDDSRDPRWLMFTAVESSTDRVAIEWSHKILTYLRKWTAEHPGDDRGPNSNKLWKAIGDKQGIRRQGFIDHVERLVSTGAVVKTHGAGKRIHYAYAGDDVDPVAPSAIAGPRKRRVRLRGTPPKTAGKTRESHSGTHTQKRRAG